MRFTKKHRKYKQMVELINLYEERMVRLYAFDKYKKAGKLLLASAAPGEVVNLIAETGHIADLFNRVKRCRVLSVEFIGDNNALIHLCDLEDGREYVVRNNDVGKIFFHDQEQAEIELQRREKFLQHLIRRNEEAEEENDVNKSKSGDAT